MRRQSLRERIKVYLMKHHTEWVPKGTLCDLARASELKATGEHTGRRLRELVEDGELDIQYDKKGHAEYKAKVSYSQHLQNQRKQPIIVGGRVLRDWTNV